MDRMMQTPPLASWSHVVTEIADGGLEREKAATADERSQIARALSLVSLEKLAARYHIDRLAGGAYRLSGRISALCEQACIISLDPVPAAIEDSFDVEFWLDYEPGEDGGELSVLGGRDIEPLENGKLEVGRVVYETLAAALDPYPRKPEAEFSWTERHEKNPEKLSPFQALAKLKDKL